MANHDHADRLLYGSLAAICLIVIGFTLFLIVTYPWAALITVVGVIVGLFVIYVVGLLAIDGYPLLKRSVTPWLAYLGGETDD